MINSISGVQQNSTIFEAISNMDQQPGPSKLTSDPYGVCFCSPSTNESTCGEPNTLTVQIYPGAGFTVYASTVGQMNGVVPSRVEILNADQSDNSTSVIPKFNSGSIKQPILCHEIQLSVQSEHDVVTLQLIVENVNPAVESGGSTASLITIPKVIVHLHKCPWIFEKNEGTCVCAELLHINSIQCDINTVTVSFKKNSKWIGCEWKNDSFNNSIEFEKNSCDYVLYGQNCLDEHCSSTNDTAKFTASDSLTQCKEGREKRLCGACKANHSLTLGVPQCVDNENCAYWRFILLLFVCLLAGALLVFFLTFFNITVSEGTVNGLLFYANFVHANRSHFFPDQSPAIAVSEILRVFISWLNLDFGFVVCFYAGIDAYQKIWWDFGFLFYLFLLGLLIIYLSHKFFCVTRLVGRNVVNVLSTIMFFSYSKLVSTCIKALSFTYLQIYDMSHKQQMIAIPVWRYDKNVAYFQGKHIPLAILAIVLCIIALLYTLSLLFIQCLQRRSSWCFLKWVNKLQPFYDANTGPCREHYRFWPGFLLFSRSVLYILYSVGNFRKENKLYFLLGFCLFVFILACISPHGVYKKWPLNILEFLFFLNLTLLSAFVLSTRSHYAIYFTFLSVGIAVIAFSCILLYHGFKRVSGTQKWKTCVDQFRGKRRLRNIQEENNSFCIYSETGEIDINETTPILGQRIHRVVAFNQNELREPLLAED